MSILKAIIRPVEIIMNQLSYIKKFILILFLGGSIIFAMNMFLSNEINEKIDTARSQQLGAQYNNELKDFLNHMQQHRGMTGSYLSGDKSYEEQIKAKQTEIEQTIQLINNNQELYRTVVNDQGYWNQATGKWNNIKGEILTLDVNTSFEKHTDIINIVLELIDTVGIESELSLDTQIDRHHLIEAVVTDLPLLSEDMGQMRAKGASIINSGTITSDERMELLALHGSARLKLATLQDNLSVAMNYNENLVPLISPLLDRLLPAATTYFEYANNSIIETDVLPNASREYFEIATSAINIEFDMYEAISDYIVQDVQNNVDEQLKYRYLLVIFNVSISAIVLYFFAGFYVSVIRTINTLNKSARLIAAGDLTARVDLETKDELSEIGVAFNEMAESLSDVIQNSKQVANQLADASVELSVSADETMKATNDVAIAVQDVAAGADEQVIGAEESSTAIEQMAQGITRVAESASSIAEYTNEMASRAVRGNESLKDTVRQMNDINNVTDESSIIINHLQQDAKEIGGILNIIKDISSQTNLLALNAAIEAARAGEAGRGFAVVADEIRKLADQTALATGKIQELIMKMQTNVEQSVTSMDGNKIQVHKGLENIEVVDSMFQDILTSVNEVSRQIEDLSAVSEEMSAGAEQISASVHELAGIAKNSSDKTQTIAASAEEQLAIMSEVTKSAESLEVTAMELNKLVSKFKV